MTLTTRNVAQALAAGGALLQAYDTVWDALWRQPYLPAATLELCRLRLALLHDCQAEIMERYEFVEESKVRGVLSGRYLAHAEFTDAEMAVLEVTEVYAQDPAAITDAMADRIKLHFGEPGLVCLVEALGFIDGRIRLALMFTTLVPDARQARGV